MKSLAANVRPYLLLAVFSAGYLYPFVRSLPDGPDAGIFLNGAAVVAQGAIPSRDFVEPSGPGGFLWLGLFFKLFGTTLLTAHVLLLITGVAITLLVFYLSRRLGGSGLFASVFVLVMLIPLLPYNSPHYDSILFLLASLTLFVTAWERPAAGLIAASGLLAGVTSWFLQQEGLLLALALAAALLGARRWRLAVTLLAAYGVMLSLLFAGYALMQALPELLYANYIRPFTTYGNVNAAPYGFPIWQNLWPSFLAASRNQAVVPLAWTEAAILTVPFLVVMGLPLLTPAMAIFGKSVKLPYWLAAYALWFSEIYRLDIGHLRNGCVLLAVLFFGSCETSSRKWLRMVAVVITACVAFGGASQFAAAFQSRVPIQTRRGLIYAQTAEPVIPFLASHTKPGDDVFIYPYQPIFYFLSDVQNPTKYHCLVYGYNPDDEFVDATHVLEKRRVRYVLYDNLFSGETLKRVFPAYRQPDAGRLIMEPYLAAHYREVERAGRFTILERRN